MKTKIIGYTFLIIAIVTFILMFMGKFVKLTPYSTKVTISNIYEPETSYKSSKIKYFLGIKNHKLNRYSIEQVDWNVYKNAKIGNELYLTLQHKEPCFPKLQRFYVQESKEIGWFILCIISFGISIAIFIKRIK